MLTFHGDGKVLESSEVCGARYVYFEKKFKLISVTTYFDILKMKNKSFRNTGYTNLKLYKSHLNW